MNLHKKSAPFVRGFVTLAAAFVLGWVAFVLPIALLLTVAFALAVSVYIVFRNAQESYTQRADELEAERALQNANAPATAPTPDGTPAPIVAEPAAANVNPLRMTVGVLIGAGIGFVVGIFADVGINALLTSWKYAQFGHVAGWVLLVLSVVLGILLGIERAKK